MAGSLSVFHHGLRILKQLDKLNVLQVHAGNVGPDGQGAGSQNQLVVGLVDFGAVLTGGVDHLLLEVDGVHRGLQVNGSALLRELIRGGVK